MEEDSQKQKFNIPIDSCYIDWDLWLTEKESFLKEQGYRKYVQNNKREDFAYWKKFTGYQVGLLFYDFRKYQSTDPNANCILIQYEAMFIDCDCRIDLSVSKDMSLTSFEVMAQDFYNAMRPYSS